MNRTAWAVVGALAIAVAMFVRRDFGPLVYTGPELKRPASVANQNGQFTPVPLRDLAGNTIELGGATARPTFVHVWASWCAPCVAELPRFNDVAARMKERGIDFISVALDDAEHAQEVIDHTPVRFPVFVAAGAPVDPLVALGGHDGAVPFNALLDSTGRPLLQRMGVIEPSPEHALSWLDQPSIIRAIKSE